MARDDFKTLYRTDYSFQQPYYNEIIPDEIRQLNQFLKISFSNIGTDTIQVSDAILASISWFDINTPPFQQCFKDFEQIERDIKECYDLRDTWLHENRKAKPVLLIEKIRTLYKTWWKAVNDANAGIRKQVFDPQKSRKQYMTQTGKDYDDSKTFYEGLPRIPI